MLSQSTTAEPEKIVPSLSGWIACSNCVQWNMSGLTACPQVMLPQLMPDGVVLEEQVVLALVEHQAVGVVRPVDLRRKMELRAVPLLVERRGAEGGSALLASLWTIWSMSVPG